MSYAAQIQQETGAPNISHHLRLVKGGRESREAPPRKTKWQILADEIEQNPHQLGDYFETFLRDMREFREDFHFHHDREE